MKSQILNPVINFIKCYCNGIQQQVKLNCRFKKILLLKNQTLRHLTGTIGVLNNTDPLLEKRKVFSAFTFLFLT